MEITSETVKNALGDRYMKIMSAVPTTQEDINKVFEEQSDFNMLIPPADDSIYTNQWGAVIMNVNTLDKLLKVYRGEV